MTKGFAGELPMTPKQAEREAKLARARHESEVRMLFDMLRSAGRAWVVEYLNAPEVAGRRDALRRDLNAAMRRARGER